GCRGGCARRSPAGPTASGCWSRSSGPTCSWCRWMRCAAGGATTTCSPTCSAPGWSRSGPSGWLGCTGRRAPGPGSPGRGDAAVRHGWAAGDTLWAARLLERHLDRFLHTGEGATVRGWLDSLPAGLVGSRPRLLLAQARLALIGGHPEAVEGLLNTAPRGVAAAARQPDEPTVRPGA